MELRTLKNSALRGLLGEVTDNLFAVAIGRVGDHKILVDAYFIGGPSAEEWNNIHSAAAGIVGDFPEVDDIEVRFFDTASVSELDTLDFVAVLSARTEATAHIRLV